jgi:hypothetical protein
LEQDLLLLETTVLTLLEGGSAQLFDLKLEKVRLARALSFGGGKLVTLTR